MVNRPSRFVRAVRLTLPENDVTVTSTSLTGRLSGPITRPRMTSACWAAALRGATAKPARQAASRMNKQRRFTGNLFELRRETTQPRRLRGWQEGWTPDDPNGFTTGVRLPAFG